MLDWQQALKTCLVVGQMDCKYHDLITTIQLAIDGGMTSIQLRDKTLNDANMIAVAQKILLQLPAEIPLIINDRVEVARQLQCALHIGQRDMPYSHARDVLGSDAVIGLSIENLQQAQQYKNCGANYFGVGPVFKTSSKSNAAPVIGIEVLDAINQNLSPTPCIAIGGISVENIQRLPDNTHGFAVISAIASSPNPKNSAQQLLKGRHERL